MDTNQQPALDRLRYRPGEAAKLLGISRAKLYDRIRRGQLATVADGNTTFIARDEILRYASAPQPISKPLKDEAKEALHSAPSTSRRRRLRRARRS